MNLGGLRWPAEGNLWIEVALGHTEGGAQGQGNLLLYELTSLFPSAVFWFLAFMNLIFISLSHYKRCERCGLEEEVVGHPRPDVES